MLKIASAAFIVITLSAGIVIGASLPAAAGSSGCMIIDRKLECGVADPGHGGTSSPDPAGEPGDTGIPAASQGSSSDGDSEEVECTWVAVTPQPPATDLRWGSEDPETHTLLMSSCLYAHPLGVGLRGVTLGDDYQVVEDATPGDPGSNPQPPPPPDPAVLAASAWDHLSLPKPGVHRSPSESNHDPAHGGSPFTWVNVPTWFWADADAWQQQTLTVELRGVSVTATAVPVSLTYTPGDGGAPVVCDGPGRPWAQADGLKEPAPGSGGCSYTYEHVTESGPITATIALTWSGSWTSNTGASGSLGESTVTSTSAPFLVEQIQVMLQ